MKIQVEFSSMGVRAGGCEVFLSIRPLNPMDGSPSEVGLDLQLKEEDAARLLPFVGQTVEVQLFGPTEDEKGGAT